MHHPLLDLPCLGQLGFESGDFGVHVGEDGGDRGLFVRLGKKNFNFAK